jgi:hypothetical protein
MPIMESVLPRRGRDVAADKDADGQIAAVCSSVTSRSRVRPRRHGSRRSKDRGVLGNGHYMMIEKNRRQVFGVIRERIERKV